MDQAWGPPSVRTYLPDSALRGSSYPLPKPDPTVQHSEAPSPGRPLSSADASAW